MTIRTFEQLVHDSPFILERLECIPIRAVKATALSRDARMDNRSREGGARALGGQRSIPPSHFGRCGVPASGDAIT